MNLKRIRIIQIIGLGLICAGVIISIIGYVKLYQINRQLTFSNHLPADVWSLINQLPLYFWSYSILFIGAGMILILITTISLLIIKDNNQKNLIEKKK